MAELGQNVISDTAYPRKNPRRPCHVVSTCDVVRGVTQYLGGVYVADEGSGGVCGRVPRLALQHKRLRYHVNGYGQRLPST